MLKYFNNGKYGLQIPYIFYLGFSFFNYFAIIMSSMIIIIIIKQPKLRMEKRKYPNGQNTDRDKYSKFLTKETSHL